MVSRVTFGWMVLLHSIFYIVHTWETVSLCFFNIMKSTENELCPDSTSFSSNWPHLTNDSTLMRTNDNGTHSPEGYVVIAPSGYIVILLLSPFHSSHVLHPWQKKGECHRVKRRHTEDIQKRRIEGLTVNWMDCCNINPIKDLLS